MDILFYCGCCCYYYCYDSWNFLFSFWLLILLLVEILYWVSVLYLDDSNYVIVGVIFGTMVILLLLGIDYLAVSLLLMMWPFWILYINFFSSLGVVGIVVNEVNNVITLLLVSVIPNLLLIFVLSMFVGFAAVIVAGSYLILSVSSTYLFVFLVLIYLSYVNSYRLIILSLIPLPLFFANVAIPWYLVYIVILIGFSNFV